MDTSAPSTFLAINGAEVIVNLSASNELIAKREYRQALIHQQSARCLCGYVYVSAGISESTSDLVFSGHSLVAQCGATVAENQDYLAGAGLSAQPPTWTWTAFAGSRRVEGSFADAGAHYGALEPMPPRSPVPPWGCPTM